jgi:predicted dienelactone hydrolase
MLSQVHHERQLSNARVVTANRTFGGYTVIKLAGGIGNIDVQAIQSRCGSRHPTDSLCASPLEFSDLIPKAIRLFHTDARYSAALNESAKSHRDARIRASIRDCSRCGGIVLSRNAFEDFDPWRHRGWQ